MSTGKGYCLKHTTTTAHGGPILNIAAPPEQFFLGHTGDVHRNSSRCVVLEFLRCLWERGANNYDPIQSNLVESLPS